MDFFTYIQAFIIIIILIFVVRAVMKIITPSSQADLEKAEEFVKKEALKAKRQAKKMANREARITKLNEENIKREIYWEKNIEAFCDSPEYKFIEQFVKKYGNRESNSDLKKLQLLLKNQNWDFSLEQLKMLTFGERDRQHFEYIKAKILRNNPVEIRDIIEAYLDYCQGKDGKGLEVLAEILREKHSFNGNLLELKAEVKKVEEEVTIKIFEKHLSATDKQISLKDIDHLAGYEFEDFLKNLFLKMGFQVEQTKLSGDQGADLVVIKFGEKTVIQAKRFGGKVGNKAVQEVFAAMSLYGAQKGMVITNNYFTPAAIKLADANNIELVDRDSLEKMINNHW